MAKIRKLNLGFGGNPDSVNLSTLAWGQLGGAYESGNSRYQLLKIVDGAATAKDVVYHKTYDGTYEATVTVGNSSPAEVAGVCPAAVTENYYTLVKKGGNQSSKANGVFSNGMPVWADSGNKRFIPAGVFSGALGNAGAAAGDILNVANPCTGAWLVTELIINRTTKSTGASTCDFGIAATAATLNDGLIDGLNTGAAEANGENNFANAGTNGKAAQYGAAGTFLTGSEASGDTAGLVGTYSGKFQQVGNSNAISNKVWGVAQGTISGGFVTVKLDVPYV